ncbi:MAG: hypothetical protein A2V67_19300 [Deltaproteobacteria bacterium RBG_13_61_14]|nr:MAG: hypothetical protein A2V67_19300 [Deltaproteobacteria bacterium RBG_13_61_14]
MAEIKTEKAIEINAPVDKVWKLMLDIPSWPRWFPTLKAAGMISGQPLAQGSVFYFKLGLVGPAMNMKVTITASEPNKRVAWAGGMLGVTGVHSFDFEAQGDKTRVTSREVLQGPMVGLMKLLFNDDDLGKLHQDWNSALKAEAERSK